jgi:hypothetical protein
MWILVYNNQIQLGPREYNRWIFQDWLSENLGLTISLPQQPLGNNPIIIDENTQIIVVFFAPQPDFNPRIQQLAGPFITLSYDYADATWQVADQDIDVVKSTMLSQLANNRYNQEIAGVTVVLQEQSLWVSSDRVTRQVWLNALQLGLTSQTWKFNNNTWLTLDNQEIQAVVSALAAHVEQAFAWEKSVHDQITSASDLATLANIDINWPVVNPIT